MCLGPFPGIEASWQGAAPPKQGGHVETGSGSSSWPMVVLNSTQELVGIELLGTGQNVSRSVIKICGVEDREC